MKSGSRARFTPGRIVLALAAARKGCARAFSFIGSSGSDATRQRSAQGKYLKGRWFGTTAAQSSRSGTSTPPESPPPPPADGDLVSFYLLRHGQTNFNAIGRIQGTLDSSVLTEQGITQALEAGKTLASARDLDLGPAVIVSPMTRAQQTLEYVRGEMKKVQRDFETVETVPDIREIELFEWEGKLKEDIMKNSPEEYAAWVADPSNFNFTGRYPARDLWERAGRAWDQIRSLQSIQGQRNTLIVAHNAINQALVWTALGGDATYFRKLSWPNCAVLELQWRRGAERAERYRWVIPEASPFMDADEATKVLKTSQDDTQYTL